MVSRTTRFLLWMTFSLPLLDYLLGILALSMLLWPSVRWLRMLLFLMGRSPFPVVCLGIPFHLVEPLLLLLLLLIPISLMLTLSIPVPLFRPRAPLRVLCFPWLMCGLPGRCSVVRAPLVVLLCLRLALPGFFGLRERLYLSVPVALGLGSVSSFGPSFRSSFVASVHRSPP